MTTPPDARHAGFTLLELSVALLLSIFVAGAVMAAYRLAARAFTEAERRATLTDALHQATRRLTDDLMASVQFSIASDTTWRLVLSGERPVAYGFYGGRFLRDEQAMLPTAVEAVAFRLSPSRASSRYALLPGEMLPESARRPRRVRVLLILRLGSLTDSLATAAVLRSPPPWPPH